LWRGLLRGPARATIHDENAVHPHPLLLKVAPFVPLAFAREVKVAGPARLVLVSARFSLGAVLVLIHDSVGGAGRYVSYSLTSTINLGASSP
jgi:hypothetical protein